MLTDIAAAITDRLERLGIFNRVERQVSKQTLSNPPCAVFYLAGEGDTEDSPEMIRRLYWDILIVARALDSGTGQRGADYCIDAVRTAFFDWVAVAEGGCKPAHVGEVKLVDGVNGGNIVYGLALGIDCFPAFFNQRN